MLSLDSVLKLSFDSLSMLSLDSVSMLSLDSLSMLSLDSLLIVSHLKRIASLFSTILGWLVEGRRSNHSGASQAGDHSQLSRISQSRG